MKIDSVKEPEVVAKTMEKFVTFSIGNLKFKDSLQFLNFFENFRDVSITNYGLDPAHFVTAPGLSWTAGLKYTKVKPTIQKLKAMTLKNHQVISSW